MDLFAFLEGGGLLVLCALLVAFAIARNKKAPNGWPRGVLRTNALVLTIIASGFFGLATFIDSFVAN